MLFSVQRQRGDLWNTSAKFCHLKGCGQRCGESAWSVVINEVRKMKTNGARNSAAVTTRSEWFASASRKRRLRTDAGGFRRTSVATAGRLAVLNAKLLCSAPSGAS